MSRPKAHDDSDDEPRTFFEIEQRRLDNPGESKVGSDVSSLPPQPPTSPWASDPVPDEPLIEGDSNEMGIAIDQLNR
jgi:hypothetical protein